MSRIKTGKKEKKKTKRSRTHSSTCVSLREKGSKDEEKDACAALIEHGQTMYSACFILSRFINVNISSAPTTLLSPLLLNPVLLPPWWERCKINCSKRDIPSFVVTIHYFLPLNPSSRTLSPSFSLSLFLSLSLSLSINLLTLFCEILSE